jgi:hypothetical protein
MLYTLQLNKTPKCTHWNVKIHKIEKKESPKNAQNDKIENIAGSV